MQKFALKLVVKYYCQTIDLSFLSDQ